jgi:hypothetical protein
MYINLTLDMYSNFKIEINVCKLSVFEKVVTNYKYLSNHLVIEIKIVTLITKLLILYFSVKENRAF